MTPKHQKCHLNFTLTSQNKNSGPDWDASCYHSFHFKWAKSQTSAKHQYSVLLRRQVLWFDRVWASIWSGLSEASRRGTTCDKWVLSGGCGVGKLTLFPSDYISRQENGTQGEWLEFHRTRGRRSFSLVCRLIKRPGGGVEEVCWTRSGYIGGPSLICPDYSVFIWRCKVFRGN